MIFLWALLINSHVLAAESEFHANRAETENVLQVGDNEELVDRWSSYDFFVFTSYWKQTSRQADM